MSADRRMIDEIAADLVSIEGRVRPTVCATYRSDAPQASIEGRVSEEDFDMLMTYAWHLLDTVRICAAQTDPKWAAEIARSTLKQMAGIQAHKAQRRH